MYASATAAFVVAVAPALGVTVYDLYDQPSHRFGVERGGVAELETAVMAGQALADDGEQAELAELASDGYAQATRVVASPGTPSPAGPETFAIRGILHLHSAILAARQGSAVNADAHLAEATDLARHLPPVYDLYDTAFCTANVHIHAVAAVAAARRPGPRAG